MRMSSGWLGTLLLLTKANRDGITPSADTCGIPLGSSQLSPLKAPASNHLACTSCCGAGNRYGWRDHQRVSTASVGQR